MPEPQDPPAWAVEAGALRDAIFAKVHRGRDTQRKGVFGWSWSECEAKCEDLIRSALAAAHERGEKKGREEENRACEALVDRYMRWLRGAIAARRDENDDGQD